MYGRLRTNSSRVRPSSATKVDRSLYCHEELFAAQVSVLPSRFRSGDIEDEEKTIGFKGDFLLKLPH